MRKREGERGREREREKEGGRERERQEETGRDRERQGGRGRENCYFIFKRNDGCLGTFINLVFNEWIG